MNSNPTGLKCCDPHLVVFHSENTKQSTFIHPTLICNITSVVDRELLRMLSDQILISFSPSWTSYESSHLYGNGSSSVLQCHHKSKDEIIKSGKTPLIVSSINEGSMEGVEHRHMFFRNSVSPLLEWFYNTVIWLEQLLTLAETRISPSQRLNLNNVG